MIKIQDGGKITKRLSQKLRRKKVGNLSISEVATDSIDRACPSRLLSKHHCQFGIRGMNLSIQLYYCITNL